MGTHDPAMPAARGATSAARSTITRTISTGDNDLLVLTQPDVVRDDPRRVSRGGRRHHRDQHLQRDAHRAGRLPHGGQARAINEAAARIARECADAWTARTPDKPRFVAGALGPTNRTASISPDVNDPGARNVTLRRARRPRIARPPKAWSKAASTCCWSRRSSTRSTPRPRCSRSSRCSTRAAQRLPVIVSGTITDASGPHAVGPDARGVLERGAPRAAARRRAQLRARRGADASVHRGDRARRRHVRLVLSECRPAQPDVRHGLRRDARRRRRGCCASSRSSGFVNIVGGCCGTTPEHIRAIADAVRDAAAAQVRASRREAAAEAAAQRARRAALAGMHSLAARSRDRAVAASCASPASSRSTSATTRCSSTSASAPTSPARRPSRKLILAGDFAGAVEVARQQVAERRADHRRQHGRGDARLARRRWCAS